MDVFETGKLIVEKRKQKNMTQKDIAKYLNVSDKAVSKWERGEGYPEVTTLPKLAFLLGVTVDELLLGKSESIDNLKNETDKFKDIIIEEKEILHSYFLEDIYYKFHKNIIITYLIICIGVFINFTPIKIISAIFGLIGIAFYYFIVYDFKISIKRFRIYINEKVIINNNKLKYSNIFIGTSIIGLLIISYISLQEGMLSIKNYYNPHQNAILSISHTNSTVLMIIVSLLINLLIFNVLYNKIFNDGNFKNIKTIIISNLLGTLLAVFGGILIIGYKFYRLIPDTMYGHTMENDLIIAYISIGIIIILNLVIQKIIIKEKLVNNLYFFIANILESLILIFGIIQNIEGSKNNGTNILAIIYSGNIFAFLLVILTICHFINILILNTNKIAN